MKKITLIILVTLFGMSPAFAAWSPNVQISEVIAEGITSSFVLILDTPLLVEGTIPCTTTYHYLDVSTEKGKMMFAMVLTAKASGKPVRVLFSAAGCTSPTGRGTIYGLRF